jgi:hypothetical protein
MGIERFGKQVFHIHAEPMLTVRGFPPNPDLQHQVEQSLRTRLLLGRIESAIDRSENVAHCQKVYSMIWVAASRDLAWDFHILLGAVSHSF